MSLPLCCLVALCGCVGAARVEHAQELFDSDVAESIMHSFSLSMATEMTGSDKCDDQLSALEEMLIDECDALGHDLEECVDGAMGMVRQGADAPWLADLLARPGDKIPMLASSGFSPESLLSLTSELQAYRPLDGTKMGSLFTSEAVDGFSACSDFMKEDFMVMITFVFSETMKAMSPKPRQVYLAIHESIEHQELSASSFYQDIAGLGDALEAQPDWNLVVKLLDSAGGLGCSQFADSVASELNHCAGREVKVVCAKCSAELDGCARKARWVPLKGQTVKKGEEERVGENYDKKYAQRRYEKDQQSGEVVNTQCNATFVGKRDAEGNPHGHGECEFKNGKGRKAVSGTYVGDWVNGKTLGKAIVVFSTGDRYEGYISDGVFEGDGAYYWAKPAANSAQSFKGKWHKGKQTDLGVETYANGDSYDGDFKKGIAHGMGTYTFAAGGEIYQGDFRNGKRHGRGKFYYADGRTLESDFKNAKPVGKSIHCWNRGPPHGHCIESVFEWGQPTGKGIITRKNGDKYEALDGKPTRKLP